MWHVCPFLEEVRPHLDLQVCGKLKRLRQKPAMALGGQQDFPDARERLLQSD